MGISFSDEINTENINITSENNIKNYKKIIKESIPSINKKKFFENIYDKLSKEYLKFKNIDDIRNERELTENYIDNLCVLSTEILGLRIEKLSYELDLKNIEIDLLKNKINNKNFLKNKSNKRKKIDIIDKKLDSYPRKIRKCTIDYKKKFNNSEENFYRCCPKSLKN